MASHVARFPFSLERLIAEAKRRMRRRRLFVAAGVLLAAAVGVAVAMSGGGSSQGLAVGPLTGRFSVRYPADWKRVDQVCSHFSASLLLLTTATPPPSCAARFPERQRLGRDGVAVWFGNYDPYHSSVPLTEMPGYRDTQVTCVGSAGPGRAFHASIRPPGLSVGAFICGPDYKAGEAAVRKVLASIRG